MKKNEIIILGGILCVSTATWMMSDLPAALILFGIFAIFYGIVKAIYNFWMND